MGGKWNGYNQFSGRNLEDVRLALIGAIKYLDYEMYEENNIFVISTGAANQINSFSNADYIRLKMGELFQVVKQYPRRVGLVYLIGISNEQNQKSIQNLNLDINTSLSNLCASNADKFVFLGGFESSDGVHPPNYNSIVSDLTDRINALGEIVVPPPTTIPSTTIPIATTTTTTSTVPVTKIKYMPAPPGARPGTNVPGAGAPRPTPTQTTTTTTQPNGSTTTTTVTRPTTTTTTTPTTSTTVAPDGTSTTTSVAPNGTTTTTVVTPPTTVAPSTTVPVTTTVPVQTSPPTTTAPSTSVPSPPSSLEEPKIVSYSVVSLTPENDDQRVNIDVSIDLEFDVPIIKGNGYIFFYKKNTSKALARIYVNSSEVSFVNRNTVKITPRNVLTYDTEVSVIINPNVFRSSLGKSWSGNVGKWDSITFTTIKKANTPTPTPTTPVSPEEPKPKPPPKDAPDVPDLPEAKPPKDTTKPPDNKNVNVSIRTNDGLWEKDDESVGMSFKAIKQTVHITETNPNTSWVLQFNILDNYGTVKNIGRIGLERDAPKSIGKNDSSSICFFSMYGAMKTLPDATFQKYREIPSENKISDRGPGLSLRNKIIWRQKDSFEFRVSFSLTQSQEYNVTSKCLSSQRPLIPNISDTIYETDTDKIYMWDGLNWFQIASSTLNIAQGRSFENPNTFIVNGNWWNAIILNKTVKKTYLLGNIFVPSDYLIIDAERNYVKYVGLESEKKSKDERQSFANFLAPIGFNADGVRGVYKSRL